MRERANVGWGMLAVAMVASISVNAAQAGSGGLIISEIVDATLPSGLPKWVELTNTSCDDIDLSSYSIGNVNNGGATMGFDALVLSGTLAAGDSFVVSYESGDAPGMSVFFDTYGFDADNIDQGAFINGDDVVVLFNGAGLAGDAADGSGTPVADVYGVVGVDGTGQTWEYTDGYSFRNPDVIIGSATFNEAEWTIAGANALETGDDVEELALILANTNPGTHAYDAPSCGGNGGLIISEIVDATLPGGLPKFVELTNTNCDADIDLSGFSIGNINNGGTTMGFDALVLSGTLAAGDSFVISYESGDAPGMSIFFDTYGFDADELTPGGFINGDDVVVLFAGAGLAGDPADGSGTPVADIYGVVGVDGTGEIWEYTDGYSFRNAGILLGNVTFDAAEWTIGGANSLETGDDVEELALILANTNPGTHTFDNPACGGGTDTVVINEIIQNPAAVGDSDGEWFEVFNPGGSDVDLNGWTIADNDGDSHVVGASVLVPAGGFAVLCLNSDSGTNGGVTCDYQYSGISLSNGADELVLFDGGLNEIDRVEWDNGATFPDPNGASMALRDPALDNNVGANWCEASTPFGDGDNGTPGAANICAATGSCCVDGVCSDDVVEADCAGDYQGDGTTCVDVVCPLPTGACCVNGVCSDDVLEIDCAGEFQGVGTVCADVECPAVEGACCFAGFCKDNVEENMCAADGGTFQGEGSTCDGSGGAGASSTKAGTVTQSVDTGGAGVTNDYYGSGNDDDFGEYGVTTFNFDSSDFGGAVSGIASASLTVTVNDRGFSDGNAVEFFFTTDTVGAGYTFNDALVNGIDPAQYTFAPVSLGVFNIPEMAGRAGGETDTFALDLSGVSADLINSINNGTDFQIIVAATVAAHDITYSGVGNTFDPGDPTLEIVAEGNGGTPVDCGAAPVVSINEIRIDQPGPDNDEYFELFGTPGQSLDGLWYIVIGDTGTNSGIIESATPLTGLAIDGNGFFVAADDTFTLGTADLTGNLNFENSDNVTHLLVAGFMANLGDDLDADDDCVLDVTPWAGQLDLIALIEEDNPPANTECHYGGTTLGPDGTFVPGHSARCPDGDGEWRVLAFDPADGDDTPGAANFCVDPTGACCFTTGVCEVLTADECAAGAGSYLGDDEACEGDSDADGTDGRCGDNCPDDPNKTEPGVCGCGVADDDSDADGVLDCNDGCPFDPNKTEPGICGCGFADVDTDNDGFLDCEEICDNDPNKQDPGVCGCGTPDVDTDADTVLDCNDQCPGEDDTVDENMNSIPDCLEQPETVPTVSTWGLIALALLLLTAAKVTSTRREFA